VCVCVYVHTQQARLTPLSMPRCLQSHSPLKGCRSVVVMGLMMMQRILIVEILTDRKLKNLTQPVGQPNPRTTLLWGRLVRFFTVQLMRGVGLHACHETYYPLMGVRT